MCLALLFNLLFLSEAYALDPPANIRLDGADLMWDEVPGANEYHLYYFDSPIPSSTVLGNYLLNTGTTHWPLDLTDAPFGYYTVVALQIVAGVPVEFSLVTDGEIVAYLDSDGDTDSETDTDSKPSLLVGSGQEQSFYPGDDGDKRAGVQVNTEQRYVVNGDGTFTDTITQLVWIADSECIPLMNWVGALDYANGLVGDATGSCATLQDGSRLGDWRLANIVELQTLYNYGPLGVAILNVPLSNLDVVANEFWSSTSFGSAPSPNDIGLAWEIQFLPTQDTGSHVEQKNVLNRAWAVRGW